MEEKAIRIALNQSGKSASRNAEERGESADGCAYHREESQCLAVLQKRLKQHQKHAKTTPHQLRHNPQQITKQLYVELAHLAACCSSHGNCGPIAGQRLRYGGRRHLAHHVAVHLLKHGLTRRRKSTRKLRGENAHPEDDHG